MTVDRRNPHVRANLLRAILQTVDDTGPQQFLKVTGLAGQIIGEAVRSQHFGHSSNPPVGAEGLMLSMGGGHDRLHAHGFEHPKYRPTGLKPGDNTFYDANKNRVDLNATGVKITDSNGNIVQTMSGKIVVKPASGSLVYLGGDGTDGSYDFVSTVSGPSINVKAKKS